MWDFCGSKLNFLKYFLFVCNFLVWFFSLCVIIIGVWSEYAKGFYESNRLFFANPSVFILISGSLVFSITFLGVIGVLRENFCLMRTYIVCLTVIIILEISLVAIVFSYKDKVESSVRDYMLYTIPGYTYDPDLEVLIDGFQKSMECCGADGPNDWDHNAMYNCSSTALSRCGVPYSCCQEEEVRWMLIMMTGCITAVEEWLSSKFSAIAGFGIGLLFIQIAGVVLTEWLCRLVSQKHLDHFSPRVI